jgi:hypothetical protein
MNQPRKAVNDMPRYIDAELLDPEDFENCTPYQAREIIEDIPTADVVPKSEFYRVYNELEYLKSSILPRLRIDLQMANTRAYEVDDENDRLRRILNSYALQYGTVKDQQAVIDKAKTDVAREIFEEIERICVGMQDYTDYAELKKKYTEVPTDEV